MKTFKKGDHVVCNSIGGSSHLTEGKTYVVSKDYDGSETYMAVIADNGEDERYYPSRFDLVPAETVVADHPTIALERIGDIVKLTLTGPLTQCKVQMILNVVYA
jgi:hypothetical protein